MKTLFPAQEAAKRFFLQRLLAGGNTLDSSDMGTGKTVVAAQVARGLDGPVAVIAPKSTLTEWRRELAECGVDPVFVINYEKIRNGSLEWLDKRGKNGRVSKKIMNWNLPEGTTVVLDECHNCKGPFTQNAQLLISLAQQGFRTHSLSATASSNPTEMRATGFAWGCHSLHERQSKLFTWQRWMRERGCRKNAWGQWERGGRKHLVALHDDLYGRCAHKVTIDDLPTAFRDNWIVDTPIDFTDDSIADLYDDAGFTPDVVATYLETGKLPPSEFPLVDLLRARQLAEAAKVGDISRMITETVEQNHSVVVFVNFTDTLTALRRDFPTAGVVAGDIDGRPQTAEHRQRVLDDFAKDKIRVVLANSAAGGTGVSFHDRRGEFPRVSLISPSFNEKEFHQILGRTHRNGMKSDAIQRILVAAGTIEEQVIRSVRSKLADLKTIHG